LKIARKEIRKRKADMVLCELFGCQKATEHNSAKSGSGKSIN
jgi:hypothetical protein